MMAFGLGGFVVQGCTVYGEGGRRVESANPCKVRDQTGLSYLRPAIQLSHQTLGLQRVQLSGLSLTGTFKPDSWFSYPFCLCRYSLKDTLTRYEKVSSARVNCAKSKALWVGHGNQQALSGLPGGLEQGIEGLKVLGVFLGTEGFQKKNWEGVKEKVCTWLSKWKWLLPQMSYREKFWFSIIWLPQPSGTN